MNGHPYKRPPKSKGSSQRLVRVYIKRAPAPRRSSPLVPCGRQDFGSKRSGVVDPTQMFGLMLRQLAWIRGRVAGLEKRHMGVEKKLGFLQTSEEARRKQDELRVRLAREQALRRPFMSLRPWRRFWY